MNLCGGDPRHKQPDCDGGVAGKPTSARVRAYPRVLQSTNGSVGAKHCYSCHTQTKMGGLQLGTREHAFAGGKDGGVIVPGDAARSLLYRAVSNNREYVISKEQRAFWS